MIREEAFNPNNVDNQSTTPHMAKYKKIDTQHWCAGYIIDVSYGKDLSKWRWGTSGCSKKCYKIGEAAKVLWDAVGAHPSEETTVPFRPIGRKKVLGGCISNNK